MMRTDVSHPPAFSADDARNFFIATDAAAVFLDNRLRVCRSTPRADRILGLSAAGGERSLLDTEFAASYADMAEDAARMFASLAVVEREIRVRGGHRYVVRWLPERRAGDAAAGAVLALFDVTGQRRAEERARASSEQLRLVTAAMDEAVVTLDARGCVVDWNLAAERMLGYRAGAIAGHSVEQLWPPSTRRHHVLARALQRAEGRGTIEFERSHVHVDGSMRTCHAVLAVAVAGRSYRYVMLLSDRTRDADATALERRQCADVRRAHAQKNEFLAVMSHELRHPLNLISVAVESLSRMPGLRDQPAAAKAAETIRRAVHQQSRIIDDLLDLSRLHTGKLKLVRSVIDATSTLGGIAETARADAAAAGLAFDAQLPTRAVPLCADPVRLDQIVWNLVSNAIKFTPCGGRIELRVRIETPCLRIDVVDTGRGIDAELLPHVFDMYAQGASGGGPGGMGIGLALVRQLVELQDGSIEASSDGAGQGCCFTVWLPLHLRTEPPPEPVPASALDGLRVLVVDDDADTVESLCALLRLEGASPVPAHRASAALQILDREQIDVLLSDIGMPDMDGYAFIRRVRSGKHNRAVPAIAVSGYERDADVRHALADGFDAHLPKPLRLSDLTDAVVRAQWLSANRARAAKRPLRA